MNCVKCGKEFDDVKVERSEPYDRGDGVMYGATSYSTNPVCPHCGHNNSASMVFGNKPKE